MRLATSQAETLPSQLSPFFMPSSHIDGSVEGLGSTVLAFSPEEVLVVVGSGGCASDVVASDVVASGVVASEGVASGAVEGAVEAGAAFGGLGVDLHPGETASVPSPAMTMKSVCFMSRVYAERVSKINP